MLRECHAMCRAVCMTLAEEARDKMARDNPYTHYVQGMHHYREAMQRLLEALGEPQ